MDASGLCRHRSCHPNEERFIMRGRWREIAVK
jgi:hypothetical protein